MKHIEYMRVVRAQRAAYDAWQAAKPGDEFAKALDHYVQACRELARVEERKGTHK